MHFSKLSLYLILRWFFCGNHFPLTGLVLFNYRHCNVLFALNSSVIVQVFKISENLSVYLFSRQQLHTSFFFFFTCFHFTTFFQSRWPDHPFFHMPFSQWSALHWIIKMYRFQVNRCAKWHATVWQMIWQPIRGFDFIVLKLHRSSAIFPPLFLVPLLLFPLWSTGTGRESTKTMNHFPQSAFTTVFSKYIFTLMLFS